LIDNKDFVLYRRINDYQEQAIPISSNASLEFMCISRKEFNRIIDDLVKAK
jgi:hypothetical protein